MLHNVILGIAIPFIGTALGSACVFFMKKELGRNVQRALLGFAGGVMVAASIWSLLIPAMNQSADKGRWAFLPAFIGFWLGIPSSELISGKQDKRQLMDSFGSFVAIMDGMVIILVIAAVILGIVVLYNLGIMSYVERSRELATLKVLGFRSKKIGQLLISQNIWLTVIGVALGLPAGLGTLQWMLSALASEYEMKLMLGPLTYIVSILLTFGVSLLVGWMVARKNRKIDMVEALKNAE